MELLSFWIANGALCPVSGFPVQGRFWHTGVSPVEAKIVRGGREYDVQGQAERNGPLQPGEEKAERQLNATYNYLIRGCGKDGDRLLSEVHRALGREARTQIGTCDILIRSKDIFIYHEAGQTLEEVAQRGCKISFHGSFQDLTGRESWVGLDLLWAGG